MTVIMRRRIAGSSKFCGAFQYAFAGKPAPTGFVSCTTYHAIDTLPVGAGLPAKRPSATPDFRLTHLPTTSRPPAGTSLLPPIDA
ncbi:hypothetical protein ELQ88_29140 [Pseudomonas sp. MPC6]|nr:hypothetical protein ELQ88_29140 [Pseudomonas sp. MPC6]